MADKSTLRKMRKQLIEDILSVMRSAVDTYNDSDDKIEQEYAAETINFCERLLHATHF